MARENERLDAFSSRLEHPGLIGDMYEGLTKDLLSKAMFEGLNLSVVGGKIRDAAGWLSKQIHCMIVEGEGEQIPYTSDYRACGMHVRNT